MTKKENGSIRKNEADQKNGTIKTNLQMNQQQEIKKQRPGSNQEQKLNEDKFSIYHTLGWSVHPLKYKGKEPIGKWKRYQNKLPTGKECKSWDTSSANVGIVTGPISSIFVLDIDGEEGAKSLKELESKHSPLPKTPTVKTGKGTHYYFKYPEGITMPIKNLCRKGANGEILNGIDLRGDGGYVVAPPSVHESGSVYAWQTSPWKHKVSDAPNWLLDIVLPTQKASLDFNDINTEEDLITYKDKSYIDTAVEKEIQNLLSAQEGKRNDQLNRAAFSLGQLIAMGADEQIITSKLKQTAYQIHLDNDESLQTINSGINAGKQCPRKKKTTTDSANNSAIKPDFLAVSVDFNCALNTIRSFGKGNLIYAYNKSWLWDNSGVWKQIDERVIRKQIHNVGLNIRKMSKTFVNSVCDMVNTETSIPDERFEVKDLNVINCKNGELHFNDGKWELKPHKKEHYHKSQIEVDYNPSAEAPRFWKFLNEIFAQDEDCCDKAMSLLEMMGYSMLRHCDYEKFVILIGNGANGKSVFLKILTTLLGRKYVSAVCPSQFDNRFQRAHLHGKLANIVSELSEGGELAEATLKAIVSGEVITAEHKHRPPFEFQPYCTCWFGTNHMPHTRDFSNAVFRRAIILTFNQRFEGKNFDPHLSDTLISEIPGIFNMALDAVGKAIKNSSFRDPISSIEAKRQWKTSSDQVALFIEEYCTLTPDNKLPSATVYSTYQSWAKEAGINRLLNRKNFTLRLQRYGIGPHKGAGGKRMLSGIAILDKT